MHKPRAGGLRIQSITDMTIDQHGEAVLFRCPVYIGWDDLTVPVDQFEGISVVKQIYRHRDALAQADQRPRDAAVVSDGADGVIFCDLDQNRTDMQRYVGGTA